MIIRIENRKNAGAEMLLTSKDKRFLAEFGYKGIETTGDNFLLAARWINEWARREYGEKVRFEVDTTDAK